jgi:hypothetical protein
MLRHTGVVILSLALLGCGGGVVKVKVEAQQHQ